MERAMRGKIERGLVELITNSDDSYRDSEEKGKQTSGKIRIEIERRKKGQRSIVIIRDRAGGMNREEMYVKLGTLGGRTSGFEKGKARRGLNGRGAKDVVAFGTVHFESIKGEEHNRLIIPPSLKCQFTDSRPKKVNEIIRKKLGIPRGNGTVVTIEVESRFKVPLHETLLTDFSRYYSLRDIFSNPAREVISIDLNKQREDRIIYRYPTGEVVFNNDFTIPNYPEAKAHLIIRRHSSPFEPCNLSYREGILIKSAAAIHDCTYFGLESEPFAWRFTGELYCEFIDKLILEYDNREESNPDNPNHPANNPIRLLDPFRDGLILEHPFTQALYKKCKDILQLSIEKLKSVETPPKRDVTDENLNRKLDDLSKEISKVFEKKLKELEEEIITDIDGDGIKELGIGLHIIPSGELPIPIVVNQPKTFSIIVKHYEPLDESLPVNVESSEPDNIKVQSSPVFLKKFSEDKKVGRTTFTVEGSKLGTEAFVEVRYGGYENILRVKVIELSPPLPLPEGLTFEKPLYHLQINKEKTLILRLKPSTIHTGSVIAEITSNHPEIVVKGGGRCELYESDIPGELYGRCRVLGRQLKVRGEIIAQIEGLEPAHTRVIVEEHKEAPSGMKLKFKPVEEDFISLRYKWDKDPNLLLIGAKHPTIRRYLGTPTEQGYSGVNSPLYHAVLAEVIAEALAFSILEKQFTKEGQGGMLDYTATDTYYHKHFSEFLVVSHKNLVDEKHIM